MFFNKIEKIKNISYARGKIEKKIKMAFSPSGGNT
jgi:hypothetical protein